MAVLRIEEFDGEPMIRLSELDMTSLGAKVGDVLIWNGKTLSVREMSTESERQLRIGLRLMDQYSETFAALAKT